ncbi:hypothetical protein GCM10011385_14650 [Nitratireductor aestuarii]|uniref:DUF2125 domain-containing protein n=2 Tax=Nitratireductor aestuarii TaxID=1735103 RepID=A0A916RNL9_9HYPH|nr:hypothetical protein GCM10011385_14650 [Nitratireductor aestuarii]
MWLAIAVVAVGLIYTGFWYYGASMLMDRVNTSLARLNADGRRANCEEPDIHGYPFRLGVRCRSVFYEDVKEGLSFRAEQTETAANIYDPRHVVMKVGSPATVHLPFLPPATVHWDGLGASTELAQPFPTRVSIAGSNIELAPEGSEDDARPVARISAGELHARQVEQDVEIATSFQELKLSEDVVANVPPLEGRAMVVVNDGLTMMMDRNIALRGQKGVIEEFVVGVVGQKAGISVSGPIEFDNEGLMTAQLRIKVDDPVGTAKILAEIFPKVADPIRSATGMLTALGNAAVEIRVVRGDAFLGFVPLGKIPPV